MFLRLEQLRLAGGCPHTQMIQTSELKEMNDLWLCNLYIAYPYIITIYSLARLQSCKDLAIGFGFRRIRPTSLCEPVSPLS